LFAVLRPRFRLGNSAFARKKPASKSPSYVTNARHWREPENAERAAQERDTLERQRQSAEHERERKRIAEAESAERARLEKLHAYGRCQAIIAPPEWQAKVARDLETSVTRDAYPVALSEYLAESQVRARVEAVLKPWITQTSTELALRSECLQTLERARYKAAAVFIVWKRLSRKP